MFVLERVDTMNDEVANRLLKTLEEPASFVHLILMTDALGRVLETVVSRCQLVRFEPLPAATIASQLVAEGVPAERAEACARLALGNAARARYLASEEGEALRAEVDALVASALAGGTDAGAEPWRPLLARAEASGAAAEEAVAEEAKRRLELEPKGRERKAIEKEFEESAKREARRARRESLELGLTLTALTFRDLICIAEDAPEAVLAVRPRAGAGRAGAQPRPAPAARGGGALRGRAPGAGAERDGGPGAVGARLQAGGAGGRALVSVEAPESRLLDQASTAADSTRSCWRRTWSG